MKVRVLGKELVLNSMRNVVIGEKEEKLWRDYTESCFFNDNRDWSKDGFVGVIVIVFKRKVLFLLYSFELGVFILLDFEIEKLFVTEMFIILIVVVL